MVNQMLTMPSNRNAADRLKKEETIETKEYEWIRARD